MAERKLKVTVLGDSSKAEKALGGLGGKFGKMGKLAAAGGAALVGAAAAGGAAAFKLGQDFDKAYDTIAVGTGATGEQLSGLKQSFKNVVSDIPTDFATASSAIADLNTMTGATGPVLDKLSKSVLEASRLLGEDGAANAKVFGQALTQFQVPADQGASMMDKLFVVTQKYGVGLSDLTGQLTTYGSVMQNAGFSMSETAVFFGQLNKAGIATSRLMPGLNKAFRTWAAEGKNSRTELQKVITRMQEAGSETEALSIATETFGAEGAQRMTTAVRTGAISLDELTAALDGSEGAVARTAEQTESFGEKWQKIKNKVLTGLEPLATRVFDAVGKGMDWVSETSERLMPKLQALWERFTSGGVTVGDAVDSIKTFLGDAIAFIKSEVIPAIRNFYERNRDTFEQIKSTIKTVMDAVKSIIKTVIGVVKAIWDRWGEHIMAGVKQAFDAIMQTIRGAMKVIEGIIETVTAIIKGDWSAAWDGIKKVLSGALTMITGAIKTYLLIGMGALVKRALGAVLRLFGRILGKVVSTVSSKFRSVVSSVRGRIGQVKGVLGAGLRAIRAVWNRIWNGLKSKVTGIWRGIKSSVSGAITFIRKKIEGLLEKVRGIPGAVGGAIASAVKSIPGGGLVSKAASWLGRWHGGSVKAGQPYIVGEKRPEVFVPNQSGRIVPRVNGAGVGGGVTIAEGAVTVTVHGSGNPVEIGAAVREALSEVVHEIRAGRR